MTPSSEFLTHVLEYHTKTRTVHTYALAHLGAFSASRTFSSPSTTCSFPLAYHLPALAHALRTSLTPTQTAPLATAVLRVVESAWTAVKDVGRAGEGAAKKRKAAADTDRNGREVPAKAQAFSHVSRVAGTVLSSLPSNAYTDDGEYSLESLWRDAGKLGWTIVWDCLREGTEEGGESEVKGKDGKKRRHAVEAGPLFTRYPHTVTSATLRFLYDVRARVSFPLGDCDRLTEPEVETLLNVARDEASEPWLVLETVGGFICLDSILSVSRVSYPFPRQIRTLFWHMWYTHNRESQKRVETRPIFTVTLDILTARISSKSKWSGVSADLTRDNLGLAILYVLTDRWIDILE